MNTIRIIVSGKVQGVYFRQSTKEIAIGIGITGTVKNLSDGRVEVIATGTSQQLQKLADWCKQGPSRAHVTNIEVESLYPIEFGEFKIVSR